MKAHRKLMAALLAAGILSQSLLANVSSTNTYIPLRPSLTSIGFEVEWQSGNILISNQGSLITTIDVHTSKDHLYIEDGVTYVDPTWLNAQLVSTSVDELYTNAALTIVQHIIAEDFDTIWAATSDEIKSALTANDLAVSFAALTAAHGPITNFAIINQVSSGGYTQVDVLLTYSEVSFKLVTVFDEALTVHSLMLMPVAEDVSLPTGAVEKDMIVQTGDYTLPATLTLPSETGSFPVVVLVHGSGPNDRDETLYGTKVFRDLAYGLAEKGIAILRYDKRTYVYANEVAADPTLFDYNEEVIDDAISAIDLMKLTDQIDGSQIYVLGHSLGAMSIPMIRENAPGLAGYIMAAGPARNLIDVVLEQLDYLSVLQIPSESDRLAYLEQVNGLAELARTLTYDSELPELSFIGINNKTWADLNNYDQVALAKEITEPLFIFQGGRDYQVTMTDFELWNEALSDLSNVIFKDYPDLNHLFVTGEGKSVPDEYIIPGRVSQAVIDDIASFILN